MKRYLLTANRFSGTAILVYNEAGSLIVLDLTETDMSAKYLAWFFRNIPTSFGDSPATGEIGLQTFLNDRQGVKVIEEDVVITFDMFWEKYKKKINRDRCVKEWDKLNKVKQVAAFYGVASYDRYLSSLDWKRNKADPENYLKKKMWENEWQ